jgi:FUS-interacting serine-arginine-rich protein 1
VSLLVRNVAPTATTQELTHAFSRIGKIRDVYIPRDFHSQQPKGFAFIEYETPDMAREARDEMDRFVIRGRELEVVFAQERRKTPNEMRGRVVSSPEAGGAEQGSAGGSAEGGGNGNRRSGGNFERYVLLQYRPCQWLSFSGI